MRAWEYRFDPTGFDPAPFARYRERARAGGVVITTLASERDRDPGALRKAYDLHNAVDAEIPSTSPFQAPPFERFVERNVTGPNVLLDAYFIAKIGDEYVGESTLRKPGTGAYLLVNTTGVRQPYRGRGIAMALKLATIDYARTHECPQIRTWNEINNAGMLAINDRLGFVRTPAWITYERRLAPGERCASEPEGGPR
jgi:GNAT superfamily N-acetyltransferase